MTLPSQCSEQKMESLRENGGALNEVKSNKLKQIIQIYLLNLK